MSKDTEQETDPSTTTGAEPEDASGAQDAHPDPDTGAAAGQSSSDSATDDEETGADGEETPKDELTQAKEEASANYERYLRAAAELENFRKRTVKMRSDTRDETLRDILMQIAPLLDNMRRALGQDAADGEAFKQGVEIIFNQFQDILKGYGLEEIEAVGQSFDPNIHEAMLEVESQDQPAGIVIEEMEKGYKLRDKVMRPARVVVSKGARAAGEDGAGESEDGAGAETEHNDETETE